MTDDPCNSAEAELTRAGDATSTRGRAAAQLHPVARLPEEWAEVLSAMGERPFRAKQIFRWIHERGVMDPEHMTDLSKALRAKLRAGGLASPASVADVHRSADGTRKLVLQMSEGARVECVLIPMTKTRDADAAAADDEPEEDAPVTGDERGDDAPAERVTLCVSTQFGCAMGCVFCASGQAGLVRGLGAAEVVVQVLMARRYLEPGEQLANLVFMGMGEPLHHYEETSRAIRLLTHPDGRGMSPRRITVSTVGLVPGLRRLGAEFAGKVGLAVSLHAPDDATRAQIIPMNQRYSVGDLMAALAAYPLPPRRRITIEYTLIDGVNDSLAQARQLAGLLRGLPVKINLIPMNPIDASELGAPARGQVDAFRRVLVDAGYSCFLRTRRGDDVSAACGQLAMRGARLDKPAS